MSKPLTVKCVQFPAMTPVDVPGKSMASSVTTNTRHHLSFDPATRLIRVAYRGRQDDPVQVAYVPLERVSSFELVEEPVEAAAPAAKGSAKT